MFNHPCPIHCQRSFEKCSLCPYHDDMIAHDKEQDEIIEFMEEQDDKKRASLD